MTAAEGASNSINLMKSVISCGGAIVVSFQIETDGRRRVSPAALAECRSM
jgi:hypothetical protein